MQMSPGAGDGRGAARLCGRAAARRSMPPSTNGRWARSRRAGSTSMFCGKAPLAGLMLRPEAIRGWRVLRYAGDCTAPSSWGPCYTTTYVQLQGFYNALRLDDGPNWQLRAQLTFIFLARTAGSRKACDVRSGSNSAMAACAEHVGKGVPKQTFGSGPAMSEKCHKRTCE